MYQIRKQFKFEGAHILAMSFAEECQRVHGHSYIIEVFFEAKELNADGMVIDFKKVNEIIKPLLERWDHMMLVPLSLDTYVHLGPFRDSCLLVPFNPTAENMAKHLFEKIAPVVETITDGALKVRVHETATGWAEYWERS